MTTARKCRVLLVSHTYFPSDYRGKLREMASDPSIKLQLAAIERMTVGKSKFEFQLSDEDTFEIEFLPSLFRSRNIVRIFGPLQLVNLLRTFRPDVVHAEAEPHSLSLFQLALLRPIFGYRLSFFSWENIYRPTRPGFLQIERFNFKRASAALVGNQDAARVLRKRGFRRPIHVIPQVGIAPERWVAAEPDATGLGSTKIGPLIGFVGRLVTEKGVGDLLSAFAMLPTELNARLVFVGEGELRDHLEVESERRNLGGNVLFTGPLAFDKLPSIMKSFDVLAVPSITTPIWKEQFGHVIVEAMAAGVPVVGSDSGAIPEVIADAGLIFREGDPASLVSVLRLVLADPAMRKAMSERGLSRVRSHYSDRIVGSATIAALRSIFQ